MQSLGTPGGAQSNGVYWPVLAEKGRQQTFQLFKISSYVLEVLVQFTKFKITPGAVGQTRDQYEVGFSPQKRDLGIERRPCYMLSN